MSVENCIICGALAKHKEFNLVSVYDNPKNDFAYNLYQCDGCGAVCKEMVWNNKGTIWLEENGTIYDYIEYGDK